MRLSNVGLLLVGTLLIGWSLAYQQVVRAAAPDPSIVYAHGYYHMTYTSGDHIEMVRSKTLRGLLVGKVRTVYNEYNSTAGRSANIVRTYSFLALTSNSHPLYVYTLYNMIKSRALNILLDKILC